LTKFGFISEFWPKRFHKIDTRRDSTCKAYYNALHVSPVWEVSLLIAFLQTVSDVTNYIVPIAMLVAVVFFSFGYRLRIRSFALEPGTGGSLISQAMGMLTRSPGNRALPDQND
jgi:hypothetical protein